MSYSGQKIYYNDDLMYIINQFDSTHIEKHKFLIKDTLNQICETSHSFWYNKYEKALRNHLCNIKYILELQDVFFDCNIKYILELQDAFFDTLILLGIFI